MDIDAARDLNGGEDEDEALRRAIALSLGASEEQTATPAEAADPKAGAGKPASAEAATSDGDVADSGNSFSLAGLDRKKMEAERLARAQKRKAAELGDVESQQPPQKVKRAATSPADQRPKSEAAAFHSSAASTELPFPKGAVKKTWVYGQPRTGDDIKIEEVLQKNDLQLAILSSFQWDEEWLMGKLDLRRTKVLLIAYAADDEEKAAARANMPLDTIRFCYPPMHGPGYMHSKLQILKFTNYLRIVVPTGNLVSYDWGETGTLENMVFLIDLPKRKPAGAPSGARTHFHEELCYFLTAQGVDTGMVKSLDNYDFSETARYGFVHTISGAHQGDSWTRTGYSGLGRAVNTLGWSTDVPVEVDFLCSSLGAINNDFLSALYNACQGDSGLKEYEARANKPRGKLKASLVGQPKHEARDHFRIYFPSRDTVVQSRGGKGGAGTICFQSRWWDAPTFPQKALRDAKNVREGILMHSKLMFVRRGRSGSRAEEKSGTPPQSQSQPPAGGPAGWAYVGSANMSESAWGRLVKDRATGEPKMSCRNWECGVLVPAGPMPPHPDPPGSDSDRDVEVEVEVEAEGSKMLDAFAPFLPVPLRLPGAPYVGTAKRPWFFKEDD